MRAEQRRLRRIENKYGVELKAIIVLLDVKIEVEILNYNSLGVSIHLPNLEQSRELESCVSLSIMYGSAVVCQIYKPKLLNFFNAERRAVFALESREKVSVDNRPLRAEFGFSLQGSVFGVDPYTLDQTLSFRLSNISREGFSIISSKSNRHLTPGLKLQKFTIMLPGYELITVDFQIKNIRDTGTHLKLGCKFLKIEKKFLREIEKIILTSSAISLPDNKINYELKQQIQKVKKFSDRIRVRRLTNDEEYEKVLKIRFKAYREANKTKDGETWKDMADPYDEYAVIYVAYMGQTLAGTIRLVYRSDEQPLPLEQYLDISRISSLNFKSIVEISRFAIDPHFQGTDLFYAIFRKTIFEIGAKGIVSPVCMATKKLASYYKGIGAFKIAESIPHPTIADETLTLYLFDPSAVIGGKMSALGWFFVAEPALKLLRKFNFIRSPSLGIGKYLKIIAELAVLLVVRFQRRWLHADRSVQVDRRNQNDIDNA